MRKGIVVFGMHRSGTSTLTRILSIAGARLPKNLMSATASNERGHWESQSIADYNHRVLAALDTPVV